MQQERGARQARMAQQEWAAGVGERRERGGARAARVGV